MKNSPWDDAAKERIRQAQLAHDARAAPQFTYSAQTGQYSTVYPGTTYAAVAAYGYPAQGQQQPIPSPPAPQRQQQPAWRPSPPAPPQYGQPPYYPPQYWSAATASAPVAQRVSPVPTPAPAPAPSWHSVPQPRKLAQPTGKGLSYAELMARVPAPTVSAKPVTPKQQTPAPPRTSPTKPKPVVQLPQPPPPPPKAPQGDTYPPSLLCYVERSFARCSNPTEKETMQKLLKLKIQQANLAGVLWTQDWDSMAVPSIEPEPSSAKRKAESKLSKKQLKKLRKQQAAVAAAANSANTASLVQSHPTNALNLNEFQRRSLTSDPAVQARSARFGGIKAQASSSSSRPLTLFVGKGFDAGDDDIELDWEALRICGTCTQLEKKYLRLTSAPDPSTVRPRPILKKALAHILAKWESERHYLFFWEQMKSLRQDLTIQHIQDEFTVEVYETNARICLEVDDLSEYNQCQTQLGELYANPTLQVAVKHHDEFLGYRLCYLMLTNDPMSIGLLLMSTTVAERTLRSNDYCRFFRLSSIAPYLSGNIIRHLYPSVRFQALQRVVATYRPTVPVAAIADFLGLSDDHDACRTFLERSGASLQGDSVNTKMSNIVRVSDGDDAEAADSGVTHGLF
ncbi:hypothetical protein PBRA_009401 [Plasmodiophora brassicae]|uniref:SAC3/GANP/THP3 conserved domain-containing protein n=1 Tax=Plasmodiophora brassicae TaxID=37360 RepID=A0A0G4J899_PLABS|nr:hypothetical protein PBRA_009401 [Plasmodiophora brassicae]